MFLVIQQPSTNSCQIEYQLYKFEYIWYVIPVILFVLVIMLSGQNNESLLLCAGVTVLFEFISIHPVRTHTSLIIHITHTVHYIHYIM